MSTVRLEVAQQAAVPLDAAEDLCCIFSLQKAHNSEVQESI